MSIFYEIDSTRFSHREYWWWYRSPLVLFSWLNKWTRTRTSCSSDDPHTESTLPFLADGLPAEIAARFEPIASELVGLGFFDPVYHVIYDHGAQVAIYWATFRHSSGSHFARIHQRVWHRVKNPYRAFFCLFFTEFTDGTFFISSSGKPDMAAPKSVQMNRMQGAGVGLLWQKHQEGVFEFGGQKLMRPVASAEDLIAASERHHVLVRDFHLARGVFRVPTEADVARAAAYTAKYDEAQSAGLKHPAIIAELDRLQRQTSSWRSVLWVLVGSVAAFIAIGMARWSWKTTLWLVPALFVHEAGHWVVMRFFKYRNLRMFFIPLFGAAVAGRHWNVPGWKKALVSLAGPLPSIALGIALGGVGMALHAQPLIAAATVVLILNGINLLPILPLDGGHVLQAVLFCRNRWLDFGFRVVAIAGMLAMSALKMKTMLYVAIFTAISLPISFKLGKVADALRKEPLPEPPSGGDDRIPDEAAEAIISRVNEALPKGLSNKAVAEHVLSVYETLNAKPPGAVATGLILALHGAGLFFAIVFTFVLVIARRGSVGDFLSAAARQPQHAVKCGEIQSAGGAAQASEGTSQTVIAVTLDNHKKAVQAFAELGAKPPEAGRLILFGDSLFVSVPASDDKLREKWFDELQTRSTNVFAVTSNQTVSVSVMCIPSTAAAKTNIESELNDFFGVGGAFHLIPPWAPSASDPGFAKYIAARRAWQDVDVRMASTWTNVELEAFGPRLEKAVRRGATSEIGRLKGEESQLRQRLAAESYERLRKLPQFKSQMAVVDLHEKWDRIPATNRIERAAVAAEIGKELGSVSDAHGLTSYGSSYGFAMPHGVMIDIPFMQMNDPAVGLPALAEWLCAKGCKEVRYDIHGGAPLNEDSSDSDADR